MSEKLVGIHFGPKKDTAQHDKLLTRAYSGIIEHVKSAGHLPVITRGATHFDFQQGVVNEIWHPVFEKDEITTKLQLGDTAISAFGVIRDLGKVLRPVSPYNVPLLNGPEVIAYNDSKIKTYEEIARQFQVPTVEALDVAKLDILYGDKIVLKPDNGSGGRGVEIVDKIGAQEVISRQPDVRYIAQEFIDMTAPFPSLIKGADEEEQATLVRLSGRPKEMRLFCFYTKGAIQTIPVARMMKQGEETSDTWVFVDPDTVPDELTNDARSIYEALDEQTNAGEIYGATDFIWGSTAAEPEKQWLVGELNLWRPAVSRRKPEMARMHDKMMAEQLVRIAERKKT